MIQGVFLDIESNGLDCYTHKVMEIALKVVNLGTGQCLCHFDSLVQLSEQEWQSSDVNSLKINGLSDYLTHSKAPSREQVGKIVTQLLTNLGIHRDTSIFICQNPSFDRPFFAQLVSTYEQEKLGWPYHWLDLASMFWAKSSSHEGLPSVKALSKDAIAARLSLNPEARPHKAMAGVEHLIECYGVLIGWPVAKVRQAIEVSSLALEMACKSLSK